MKILMMVLRLPPVPCGGAEMQCWKQACALAARGHEVTVLTEWLEGGSARREIKEGVVIRRLGFMLPITMVVRRWHRSIRLKVASPAADGPDPFSVDGAVAVSGRKRRNFRWMAPVEWLEQASFILETGWAAKRGRLEADVVHVHESHWLAGFGHWVGEKLGAPVFCKEASAKVRLWPGGSDVPGQARWKVRRDRCRFIAMTAHIRGELEKAGIPRAQIVEIPNGVVLPETVAQPAANRSAIYGGNFTQGSVYKAFDVLIKAWGLVQREEPGARLFLFGEGDVSRWKRLAAQEGCGESVHFCGKAENLPEKFREAGFLVLPSRLEGLSNVLLEAQAAGLPAVVSDIGGNLAVVTDGENGLVVPVGDAAALAAACVRLVRSPDLREKLGRAARERAAKFFCIEKVAEQLEAAYRVAQKSVGEGAPS